MSTFSYFDLQKENLAQSPEFNIDDNGNLSFHKIDLNEIKIDSVCRNFYFNPKNQH